jgi:predicted DCC family thiol-disulfide oxidoreductase YuxK
MLTAVSGALLVLYDADCGIGTHSARLLRRLDRGRRLDLVPLQRSPGVLDAPPLAELRDALNVRDASGRWAVGGAAPVRIGRALALLRPLALVAGLPGIRGLVDPAYRLVARNRHRISRGLGLAACRVDRAGR